MCFANCSIGSRTETITAESLSPLWVYIFHLKRGLNFNLLHFIKFFTKRVKNKNIAQAFFYCWVYSEMVAAKARFAVSSSAASGFCVVLQRKPGRGGGWAGKRQTSKQQRALGAIIPPNAPRLPPVCRGSRVSGRLSALMRKVTWMIKCPSQGVV